MRLQNFSNDFRFFIPNKISWFKRIESTPKQKVPLRNKDWNWAMWFHVNVSKTLQHIYIYYIIIFIPGTNKIFLMKIEFKVERNSRSKSVFAHLHQLATKKKLTYCKNLQKNQNTQCLTFLTIVYNAENLGVFYACFCMKLQVSRRLCYFGLRCNM